MLVSKIHKNQKAKWEGGREGGIKMLSRKKKRVEPLKFTPIGLIRREE